VAIEYLLDGDGQRVSSVHNTFIVFHWNIDALLVKHWPLFLDKRVDLLLYSGIQVGEVKILAQLLTMFGLIIGTKKLWGDLIKGRWRMF
jgi:hypothetical protein